MEARAKVDAFARDLGHSLAELVGTEAKLTSAPVVAKYRHTKNPAITWSGRGRKPNLICEHALILHDQQRQNLIIIDADGLFLDRYLICPRFVEPGIRPTRAQHPVVGPSSKQDIEREAVLVQVIHWKPSLVYRGRSREPLPSPRTMTD